MLLCEQSFGFWLQLTDTHVPLTGSSLVFFMTRLSEPSEFSSFLVFVSLSVVQLQHILLQICLICMHKDKKGTELILICLYRGILCAIATQGQHPNIFVLAKACYSC